MKNKSILLLAAFSGLAIVSSRGQIIDDTFTQPTFSVYNTSPGSVKPSDVDRPNSVYEGGGRGGAFSYGTNPPSMGGNGSAGFQMQSKDSGGRNQVADISIASTSTYTKPNTFGLSFAGYMGNNDPGYPGTFYLGFNSVQDLDGVTTTAASDNLIVDPTPTGGWATFNGLSIDDQGHLNLIENGAVANTAAIAGLDLYGQNFTLSYGVDLTTGGISDFSLTYSNGSSTVVDTTLPSTFNTAFLFDDANTDYAEFGKSGAIGIYAGEFQVTPEPSTWALMSVGLVGLMVWSRRRAAQV